MKKGQGEGVSREDPGRFSRLPRWRLVVGLLTLLAGAIVLLSPFASWVQDEWRQRQMIAEFEAGRVPERPTTESPTPNASAPKQHEPPAESPIPSPVMGNPPIVVAKQGSPVSLTPLPIRLEIPALNLNYMVMPGIEDDHLLQGPGHYPQTPLPGAGGNTAFAGHRIVKGRPSYFYYLDKLKPGDPIRVILQNQQLTYVVERVFLTSPYDIGVLDETKEATLTLTTCDPPGLADQRLIVRAHLQGPA